MENKYLKQRVIGIYFFILSVLLIGNSSQLFAINIGSDNFRQNPFDSVEEMTNQLLIIIDSHRSNYPENEEDYFLSLNNLLGDFVEFNFVAKRVMGSSYGKVDPELRKSFLDVFKRGLIESYGRGLMAYSNEEIVILNRQNLPDTGRVIVKQEIQDGNSSYPLQYMVVRKRSDKTWTIVNVSLNGIDLTKTFASQFRNSITRHSGNLSKVIDSWL